MVFIIWQLSRFWTYQHNHILIYSVLNKIAVTHNKISFQIFTCEIGRMRDFPKFSVEWHGDKKNQQLVVSIEKTSCIIKNTMLYRTFSVT